MNRGNGNGGFAGDDDPRSKRGGEASGAQGPVDAMRIVIDDSGGEDHTYFAPPGGGATPTKVPMSVVPLSRGPQQRQTTERMLQPGTLEAPPELAPPRGPFAQGVPREGYPRGATSPFERGAPQRQDRPFVQAMVQKPQSKNRAPLILMLLVLFIAMAAGAAGYWLHRQGVASRNQIGAP